MAAPFKVPEPPVPKGPDSFSLGHMNCSVCMFCGRGYPHCYGIPTTGKCADCLPQLQGELPQCAFCYERSRLFRPEGYYRPTLCLWCRYDFQEAVKLAGLYPSRYLLRQCGPKKRQWPTYGEWALPRH
jgi:hypothetical protein